MSGNNFDVLILIARPASGKSEIIHLLKNTPPEERSRRYHIGPFDEIDDFPMLWAWFEEDAILEALKHPRLHTTPAQDFRDDIMWHVLIERVSLEYHKLVRDHPGFHEKNTVLVEFSRGSAHGGYREAFDHLSEDLLQRAAVLYLYVSYEESLRKNRKRYNPDRPDSILEHGLSDEKMERLYKDDDFADFSAGDPAYLTVKGIKVPYVVFDNQDDVTASAVSADGPSPQLVERLSSRLGALWGFYQHSR